MEGEAVGFVDFVKDGADEEGLIVDARLGLSLRQILGTTVGPSLGLSDGLGLGGEDAVVLGEKLGL
jgi:hypothetical protein